MENKLILSIVNILILLFAPFFVLGIIKKTKAFWGARKGVSIFQPLLDTIRLFKKRAVISSTTSWVFNLAPVAVFGATLAAGLFAPMLNCHSVVEVQAAFIIFSYILGFSKFFALISAMDVGSSFEGMGASREACFTTIIEPAFFIILASAIALSGNFNFSSISTILKTSGAFGVLIITIAVIALFIMLLAECSRVPVDDPTTHLELTMIHEVMILDNSGVDLALLTWAAGMKMMILIALIANLIIPFGTDFGLSAALFALIAIVVAIIIGTLESAIARIRMSHVFEFIFVMSSLALVIASLVAVKMYGV